MLTPVDLAAIRERAEKATPGPLSVKVWYYHAPTYGSITDAAGDGIALVWHGDRAAADAAFLAAARTDIPALLAHIDAITARVAELEAEVERLTGDLAAQTSDTTEALEALAVEMADRDALATRVAELERENDQLATAYPNL